MKYMKLGSKPDTFQTDENNFRFVTSELSTDVIIYVGDVKFFLHKFPLLSKSSRLRSLVAENNEDENDEIHIVDIPGGPAAFEICAKFCYGMVVTLSAYNVVAARCAAEYLEMHEENERGNLIYKIEVFLTSSIFRSWKDSIIVLQTTRSLLPWTEDLKVVSNCIDAIASKASINPSEVEWSYTYNRRNLPSENGLDTHWNGVRKEQSVPKDWWVEDLCELEIDHYERVVMAIKTKGRVLNEVIGEAVKSYAYKRLPGFAKGATVIHGIDVTKFHALFETIVWLLPTEPGSVSCSFLLRLLRSASLLECDEACKKELVKRTSHQLEDASVIDLLIPAPDGELTLYNIDMVQCILEEFVMLINSTAQSTRQVAGELQEIRGSSYISTKAKLSVSTVIDGYLAEIAKDPNLPLLKFMEIADMLSDARPMHDGLYRAIDMYLKEHPGMTKSERKKLCNLMDCKKLSSDACIHAVQNERLPLRAVVQILAFEQIRPPAAAACDTADVGVSNRLLLPQEENRGSYGTSSTARTVTEDEWDTVGESLKSMKLVARAGGSQRSSGGSSEDAKNNKDDKVGGKAKGVKMPKKLLSRLWSSKGQSGENSSSCSDNSETSCSINPDGNSSKLIMPSRNTRHSIS